MESTGNGVIIFDYDGDFDQDVYFVNALSFPAKGKTEPHSNVLYRNDGEGKFTDVTSAAHVGAAVYGQGGCVGDVNNDGFPDLFITNFGSDILYLNNGDGTFTDITERAHVGDPRWSIGCTFFDADGDGDHDLYVPIMSMQPGKKFIQQNVLECGVAKFQCWMDQKDFQAAWIVFTSTTEMELSPRQPKKRD